MAAADENVFAGIIVIVVKLVQRLRLKQAAGVCLLDVSQRKAGQIEARVAVVVGSKADVELLERVAEKEAVVLLVLLNIEAPTAGA